MPLVSFVLSKRVSLKIKCRVPRREKITLMLSSQKILLNSHFREIDFDQHFLTIFHP